MTNPFEKGHVKLMLNWKWLDSKVHQYSSYPFSFVFESPYNLLHHYLSPSLVHLLNQHTIFVIASFTFDGILWPTDTRDTLKIPIFNLDPFVKAVLISRALAKVPNYSLCFQELPTLSDELNLLHFHYL